MLAGLRSMGARSLPSMVPARERHGAGFSDMAAGESQAFASLSPDAGPCADRRIGRRERRTGCLHLPHLAKDVTFGMSRGQGKIGMNAVMVRLGATGIGPGMP